MKAVGGRVSRISIHIPRVGDDAVKEGKTNEVDISIHIPRVGDDKAEARIPGFLRHFNPHPPCGG